MTVQINPPPARLPLSIQKEYPDLYEWVRQANAIFSQLGLIVGEEDMALNYDHILFDSQELNTGAAALFTLTSAGQSIDGLKIRLTNTTATDATASLWLQADGGSEADADKILSDYTVAADSFVDINIPRMVGEGNQAELSASASIGSAITISHLAGLRRS